MATLLLTAVGSAFGPIGGAIGALAGRTIDAHIFKPDAREGSRLKEVSISGSSYGTPLARHYGAMRVPGTIIWSTGFKETAASDGGGKGQPETTSYSYSVSFAVALSSRPIDRIGRIWADGNLLRGASGDLKSGGTLRVHRGLADQLADPLLEAELGAACPAHRGLAYAVFEDLDLTDFGNRIPALSFELFAGSGSELIKLMLAPHEISASESARFSELQGFSHEGGTLKSAVQLVGNLHPLSPRIQSGSVVIRSAADPATVPRMLPEPAAWGDGDFGTQSGHSQTRRDQRSRAFSGLRYYDTARDYQPGMQHADNSEADGVTFEFPGALAAADAKSLASRANDRLITRQDAMAYRLAELDPEITPGTLVQAPGIDGVWQVAGWEWRERGIELDLLRYRPESARYAAADPGTHWLPPDRLAAHSTLRVFELPWDGTGSPIERRAFAAIGAHSGRWPGARLYAEQAGTLQDTGVFASRRAIGGYLSQPLSSSPAIRLESGASVLVQLDDFAAQLIGSDANGLSAGTNRVLVGSEILQFTSAEPRGDGAWLLSGLLRGRGGTEASASRGHPSGTPATLLDQRVSVIGQDLHSQFGSEFAALGPADTEPATAVLENGGASLQPPCPVHGRIEKKGGSVRISWTRRARGGWLWLDEVDQPLVEDAEQYEVAIGSFDAPSAHWTTSEPELLLNSADAEAIRLDHPGEAVLIRQIGTYARSPALSIADAFAL